MGYRLQYFMDMFSSNERIIPVCFIWGKFGSLSGQRVSRNSVNSIDHRCPPWAPSQSKLPKKKCVWINTYENTIFRGMNIHFNPAILMWTTGLLLVLTHCQVCCMQKKCPHFLTNPRNGWLGQSRWWSSSPLSSSKHPHSWYWCWNPRYVWISKTVFWVNSIKFPLKAVFDPIKSL